MRLSLFARTALILIGGLVVAQGASLWLQWDERAVVVSQARGLNFADRLTEAILLLESRPAAERGKAIATLQATGLQATPIEGDQVSPNTPRGQILANIANRLGSERDIRPHGSGAGRMGHGTGQRGSNVRSFDVRLKDGQWFRIVAQQEADTPSLPGDLIAQLLISLLIVGGVALVAVRQSTRPLHELAAAADAIGLNIDADPLVENGPPETQRAARAFNRMQSRLRRLIDERARALAAVSHDLRTPLTRLRLRAELVDEPVLRDQIAADLDQMAAMIDATLDYLRNLQDNEAIRPIDINALLRSLEDDTTALGKVILIHGQALHPYPGRLGALRRALQNLIDNAIKYGGSACVHIEDESAELRIRVEDKGPGIPTAEMERVTEPYYRTDASRSQETGGVGLGLSIVRDIALMHGGQLHLQNRPDGGLCAQLTLPRQEREQTTAHRNDRDKTQ